MIGQAQTGSGKTAAFGLPHARVRRSRGQRGPGARADPDPRAVHPGHPGDPHLRVAQGRRRRGRLRRRPDPHAAGAAAGRRAHRRRDGRPRPRPDLPPLADPPRHPLRRARRGRRDARPRLPRGRREDPRADARLAPDGAVQRDDAHGDPQAGRALPARAGHGEGQDAARSPSTRSSSSRSRRADARRTRRWSG